MNNKITLNSNSQTQLSWEKIQSDLRYKFGNDLLKPLRGGEYINWVIDGVDYN